MADTLEDIRRTVADDQRRAAGLTSCYRVTVTVELVIPAYSEEEAEAAAEQMLGQGLPRERGPFAEAGDLDHFDNLTCAATEEDL